jgi:hypothetical protein
MNFSIPRQSDREIVTALGKVRKVLKPLYELNIYVSIPPGGSEVALPGDNPEDTAALAYILDLASTTLQSFTLKNVQGETVASIFRSFEKVSDTVTISASWQNNIAQPDLRSKCWVNLISNLRNALKASDLEAAFSGHQDSAWNRYRDAQTEVINSLQQTTENLLIKVAERNAQLDRDRDERFVRLEEKLRAELEQERTVLEKQIADQRANLGQREQAISNREASFETKEARYVARQKQEEQIEQVKSWMENWQLTPGTTEKRRPIFWSCTIALLVTGALAGYATYNNYQILKTADDLVKLQWWQWLAMTSKVFFPFAAFTTFMVYFIRWSSTWARQHSEEEFINRSRLIDIGRASWLLEAVRDAQERNKDIPPDLLKELSRNLFSHTAPKDGDTQPQAAADILLHGLSSLRLKSPDGTEVEAKRGK